MIKNRKKPIEQIEFTEEQKLLLRPGIIFGLIAPEKAREWVVANIKTIKPFVINPEYSEAFIKYREEIKKELEMNAE